MALKGLISLLLFAIHLQPVFSAPGFDLFGSRGLSLHRRSDGRTLLAAQSDTGSIQGPNHAQGPPEYGGKKSTESFESEESLEDGTPLGSRPFGSPRHGPPQPPSSPQAFDALVTKGRLLYDWISETRIEDLTEKMRTAGKLDTGETSQSKFTSYKDLAENGWTVKHKSASDPDKANLDDDVAVDTILRSLGISSDMKTSQNTKGSNLAVSMAQIENRFNGKVHEMASEGEIQCFFNTKDGSIVVEKAFSPQQTLLNLLKITDPDLTKDQITKKVAANLPELNHISHVIALEYLEQARRNKHDPKNLKAILWHAVETETTTRVIDQILKSKGYAKLVKPGALQYQAPPWPERLLLTPETDDFYAMLATPNGGANAFLLMQYKKQFGVGKRIGQISISLDSKQGLGGGKGDYGPTLVFELEDREAE